MITVVAIVSLFVLPIFIILGVIHYCDNIRYNTESAMIGAFVAFMAAIVWIMLLGHNFITMNAFTSETVFSMKVNGGCVEKIIYTAKPERRWLWGTGDSPVLYIFRYGEDNSNFVVLGEDLFMAYVTNKDYVQGKERRTTTFVPVPIPVRSGR
jgi:hypothetical protein